MSSDENVLHTVREEARREGEARILQARINRVHAEEMERIERRIEWERMPNRKSRMAYYVIMILLTLPTCGLNWLVVYAASLLMHHTTKRGVYYFVMIILTPFLFGMNWIPHFVYKLATRNKQVQ